MADFDMELPIHPQAKLQRLTDGKLPGLKVAMGEITLVSEGKEVKFEVDMSVGGNSFWLHQKGGQYWTIGFAELLEQAAMAIILVENE